MTEYDYSPEAYEKYLATQSRVSNWVSDQVSRAPQYCDPFDYSGNAHSHSSSSRAHNVPARAQPQPRLQPLRIPESRSPTRHSPPRSSGRRSHTTSPPPPSMPPPTGVHYQSQRLPERPRPVASRSHTLPNQLPFPPAAGTAYVPRQQPVPMPPLPPAPPGHSTVYRHYQYDPVRKEIVIPPPRPGQTYVIVPPNMGPVEVIRDNGSRTYSLSQSHHSRSTSRSSSPRTATSKKGTPLIKRLLGSISPTGHGASAARGVPSRDAPPRRLRRHSTSQF